ncbi:MAG: hypothetical protein LBW85_09735 [Deltaproteobacteria bacterium]|jgi:hypothetical protein|nr:hypothetical protein [Deltaproteobacteria bacterium]
MRENDYPLLSRKILAMLLEAGKTRGELAQYLLMQVSTLTMRLKEGYFKPAELDRIAALFNKELVIDFRDRPEGAPAREPDPVRPKCEIVSEGEIEVSEEAWHE